MACNDEWTLVIATHNFTQTTLTEFAVVEVFWENNSPSGAMRRFDQLVLHIPVLNIFINVQLDLV